MPSIDSGRTSAGVIDGVNPCSTAWAIARLSSAELEQRADAGEEVEPRARHLRTALGVDRPQRLADLQVVADRVVVRRDVADLASTTKSSSPPGGTPSSTTLGTARWAGPQRGLGLGLQRPRPA